MLVNAQLTRVSCTETLFSVLSRKDVRASKSPSLMVVSAETVITYCSSEIFRDTLRKDLDAENLQALTTPEYSMQMFVLAIDSA